MSVEQNASVVIEFLANRERDKSGSAYVRGKSLEEGTGLSPADINDAVDVLVESGLADWRQWLGTAPYRFGEVSITARGRYEHERAASARTAADRAEGAGTATGIATETPAVMMEALRAPSPVGSPYGFTDEDWETVSERKSDKEHLYVVLGYQFESDHYDSDKLKQNVQVMFEGAVSEYCTLAAALPIELSFQPLEAGYGEHLFNEIARDIIGSDIAVFETSDLNPNVMVEMGVALTWDVRVLPIKRTGRPKPPSDISGQTYADYEDSALTFTDKDHQRKLVRMVERAARKKGARSGTSQ
ncbi:MAG: hypothetical protein ACI8S3_000830 [Alphaproteobacteria bacterium]|jgi:hypothetical protein